MIVISHTNCLEVGHCGSRLMVLNRLLNRLELPFLFSSVLWIRNENRGQFYLKEGQNFQFCHLSSQILIKFCSNVFTNKKQKWAKLFNLTLNGSWDIGFWNLDNFRAFSSEIHSFKFSIPNEIVTTWVLLGQSSWKFVPLYFCWWGIQKSH